MVSSIVPGATSANTLGVDPRFTRASGQAATARDEGGQGDRVQLSDAASWSASRESVQTGLAQLQTALGVGRDAQTLLLNVQNLAASPNATQSDLDTLLQSYSASVSDAADRGGNLVTGSSISVQAEPGAAPITVAGANLQLKAAPTSDDIIQVASGASISDRAALGQAAQSSLDQLQSVVDRFSDANRALQAHQGFLNAAQGATAASASDLNADSARLLALQVRQGLQSASAGAIANVEPQAVLALFKASA